MADVETSLKEALTIGGAIGAALVDFDSGMTLGTAGGGGMDLEVAAAGNTDVVRAKISYDVLEDAKVRVRTLAEKAGIDFTPTKTGYPHFYYQDDKAAPGAEFVTYDLRHPNLDRWLDLRQSLELRQEARRQQGRFRKDPTAYLASLEATFLKQSLPS